MTYSATCCSCGKRINLTFDEMDATPLFCPYCSDDLGDDPLEDYDGGTELGDWDDDDR